MKPETVQRTREHFRDNALACIAEVESGAVVLPSHTSLESYRAWRLAEAAEAMSGAWDHTFTFRQMAEYLETGVCRALLP